MLRHHEPSVTQVEVWSVCQMISFQNQSITTRPFGSVHHLGYWIDGALVKHNCLGFHKASGPPTIGFVTKIIVHLTIWPTQKYQIVHKIMLAILLFTYVVSALLLRTLDQQKEVFSIFVIATQIIWINSSLCIPNICCHNWSIMLN